jgi:hypothetical protein
MYIMDMLYTSITHKWVLVKENTGYPLMDGSFFRFNIKLPGRHWIGRDLALLITDVSHAFSDPYTVDIQLIFGKWTSCPLSTLK